MRILHLLLLMTSMQHVGSANAQEGQQSRDSLVAPAGKYACACVRPSSAANSVRLYYMGNNDGSQLNSVTRFVCTSDRGACLNHNKGGDCPFDINPNFSLVQVPNSPRC